MNPRHQDFELLQSFVRRGEQSAFADLVRRHVGLVFATAVRKVQDPGAAQEVAQDVFIALARKAWRFAPDDSVPAWLHKTTLLQSKSWLRGELRRHRREETAAQLVTTMRNPDDKPAFEPLMPLLDDALLSLHEGDRTALLLRYYENRSLRDVGAAFGVREDAAQKRVERALEKLARFFQRRGFRTASLAATVAALKASGASVSATSASAVADAALKAAPLAVTGLAALLTRAAALSKAQTVALYLSVAVVAVTWQWNQERRAKREASAMRLQIDALRMHQEQSAAEVERLRAQAVLLESRRVTMLLARANEQEAARKLEDLKFRGRGLLAAEDYLWPDDLPFVRIPKAALPSISMKGGPDTPARLESKIDQLLDLSPSEQQAVDQIFSDYFDGIDQLLANNLYETNQATGVKLPTGAESIVFVLQPMGPKIRAAMDELCTNLTAVLGKERWSMVQPHKFEFTHYEQVRLLGYTKFAWDQTQEVTVNIFARPGSEPTVSWSQNTGVGISPVPLHYFFQDQPTDLIGLSQGPPALLNRVKQWLATQAAARLSNPVSK